jgi:hypothetical protein
LQKVRQRADRRNMEKNEVSRNEHG